MFAADKVHNIFVPSSFARLRMPRVHHYLLFMLMTSAPNLGFVISNQTARNFQESLTDSEKSFQNHGYFSMATSTADF